MRKQAQKVTYFEEDISKARIQEMLFELVDRVERLEREVFPCGPDDFSSPPSKPRRGRKPKLETKEVLARRERLNLWLEQNWPRLLVPLRRAQRSKDFSYAISALIAAKKEGISGIHQPPFYDTPEKYERALGEFLRSGRFHGNPTNLAGAMAGLPELSWKRSFDLCTSHPHHSGHMLQVYWDHMRRKFPERLRELEEARTTLDVKIVLARSRSDDPVYLHLKENPDKVKLWLEKGKPIVLNSVNKL